MFQIFRKELDWEGKKLVLETGKIARQADGAVLASIGETTVLCTVVVAKSAKPGQDFFPLTVNYQEKSFAAGKIDGNSQTLNDTISFLPGENGGEVVVLVNDNSAGNDQIIADKSI